MKSAWTRRQWTWYWLFILAAGIGSVVGGAGRQAISTRRLSEEASRAWTAFSISGR